MTTCPYCGTHYTAFQSNCSNCGAPLPEPLAPGAVPASQALTPPPLPPRPISNRYVWKLLWGDGWAVTALVFLILGGVFTIVGILLTVMVVTAFVGIPFLGIGLLFLLAGLGLGVWRHRVKSKLVEVLRNGQVVPGEIESLTVNHLVRVNHQHPWTICYRFIAQGVPRHGEVITLTPPGDAYREGSAAWVLYLPESPEHNSIYPHP